LIRFIRPERRNPLSSDVISELEEAVRSVDAQKVEQLIFSGSGDAFASGADLREISSLTAASARTFAERGQRLMQMIDDLPVMTVAAINGACFGGGAGQVSLGRSSSYPRFQQRFSHLDR